MHCLSFMHRTSTLGTTSTRAGHAAKGRWVRRIDDVYDDTAGLEALRIDGHRIVGLHADRRGVDDDFVSEGIRCAESCAAARRRGNRVGKVIRATLVEIEYRKCACARRCDRKGNRPACTSGADEKNGLACRMITFPLHAEHTTDPVEHGTDPASVHVAADDIEGADLTSTHIQFVDVSHHVLLVRHCHQDAGEVSQHSCARDECGEVTRRDSERHANRVGTLFGKEPVE